MSTKHYLTAAAIGTTLAAVSASADAQSIIRQPGEHAQKIEFEVHGSLGVWGHYFGGFFFGPGFRVGIPIVRNGFIRSINNSVAISFGADFWWWPGWSGWYGNTALAVSLPVMLQWNFYLTGKWSVFGEAGVAPQFYPSGWVDSGFWVWPSFAGGARYHFGGDGSFPTLTFRAGFPTGITVGVSF